MIITIFHCDGPPGIGKTAVMVGLALYYFPFNLNIYANFHLKGVEYTFIQRMSDFYNIEPNAIVILDELYLWCWSRKSGSATNEMVVEVLSTSRKRGYNLIYTQQYSKAADIMIRDSSEENIIPQCRNIIGVTDRGQLKYQYVIAYFENGKFQIWFNLPHLHTLYDTNEMIQDLVIDEESIMPIVNKLKNDNTFLKLTKAVSRYRHIKRNYRVIHDDAVYIVDYMENILGVIS